MLVGDHFAIPIQQNDNLKAKCKYVHKTIPVTDVLLPNLYLSLQNQ